MPRPPSPPPSLPPPSRTSSASSASSSRSKPSPRLFYGCVSVFSPCAALISSGRKQKRVSRSENCVPMPRRRSQTLRRRSSKSGSPPSKRKSWPTALPPSPSRTASPVCGFFQTPAACTDTPQIAKCLAMSAHQRRRLRPTGSKTGARPSWTASKEGLAMPPETNASSWFMMPSQAIRLPVSPFPRLPLTEVPCPSPSVSCRTYPITRAGGGKMRLQRQRRHDRSIQTENPLPLCQSQRQEQPRLSRKRH